MSAATPPDSSVTPLLQTPLHALHVALGARMVPFAGYAMPVQYPAGLMAEHKHCREAAALFDVSHMGQLRLIGEQAAAALESLVPVDVIDLQPGKQRYALFTNEEGGLRDDLMITRPPAGAADPPAPSSTPTAAPSTRPGCSANACARRCRANPKPPLSPPATEPRCTAQGNTPSWKPRSTGWRSRRKPWSTSTP